MPERFTEADVRTATTRAEQCQSVTNILNELSFTERSNFARQMEAMNRADRSANPNLPQISLTFGTDAGRQEHLLDMQCVRNPDGMISQGRSDIYNMPGEQWYDAVLPDSVRMTRDTTDSENRLGSPRVNPNPNTDARRDEDFADIKTAEADEESDDSSDTVVVAEGGESVEPAIAYEGGDAYEGPVEYAGYDGGGDWGNYEEGYFEMYFWG